MNVCSLYPPNSQSLSNRVIGNVVQRAIPSHSRFVCVNSDNEDMMEDDSGIHKPFGRSDVINDAPVVDLLSLGQPIKANHDRSSPEPWVSPYVTSRVTKASKRATSYSVGEKQAMLFGVVSAHDEDLAFARKTRRRERCRVNQARYRKKQQKHAVDLEGDIRELKCQVQKLEMQQASIPASTPTKYNVWTFTTGYFRRFSYALLETTDHLDFLRATMAKNFPHLNSDGKGGVEGGEWSVLATKLLDQRFVICGSVRFDWDATMERVVNMHSQLDMLSPLGMATFVGLTLTK
ncbi:hypothetical protein G195_009539 [Phytophthora kernoviae 00238/432]|uniref:BZIP domain-containing protein n=2 Tax=Phytophthora kernoviae TaxID=325452 RepID=A0A8T0M0N4_9STRA|nr:hypothetical protein G195_009539 [Phytophthora kernoviae 00238/432]KAG2524396.1 hypothetical protein JM16_004992 [Phytophthora kernoviae]